MAPRRKWGALEGENGGTFNTSDSPTCACYAPRSLLGSEGHKIRRAWSPTLKGSESSWQGRSLHKLAVKSLDTTASAVKSKHDYATDPAWPRLRLQAGRDFYP